MEGKMQKSCFNRLNTCLTTSAGFWFVFGVEAGKAHFLCRHSQLCCTRSEGSGNYHGTTERSCWCSSQTQPAEGSAPPWTSARWRRGTRAGKGAPKSYCTERQSISRVWKQGQYKYPSPFIYLQITQLQNVSVTSVQYNSPNNFNSLKFVKITLCFYGNHTGVIFIFAVAP